MKARETEFSGLKRYSVLALLAASLASTACAPEPQTLQVPSAKKNFGPHREDVSVAAAIPSSLVRSVEWNEQADFSRFYHFTDELDSVEAFHPSLTIQSIVKTLTSSAIVRGKGPEVSVTQGSYFDLILQKQKPVAIENLTRTREEMRLSFSKIKLKIVALVQGIWFTEDVSFQMMAKRAFYVADQLSTWMKAEKLNSSVVNAMQTQIDELLNKYKSQINSTAFNLDVQRNLARFVDQINSLLSLMQITLGAADQQELDWARDIGTRVELIQSAQDALTLFVHMWRTMNPNDRYLTFYQINSSLADLLNGSNSRKLDCLASPNC